MAPEENTCAREPDIVWHGKVDGDRRAQVAKIVADGIRSGSVDLRGTRPVIIKAEVNRFDALTPSAPALEGEYGVHDIRLTVSVSDARIGEVLAGSQMIEADLAAPVGNAAANTCTRGYTQKVEIGEHLTKVIRNWLGRGADPRNTFDRAGR